MKIIVVGHNPNEADLYLNSDYVSNYHAEIILLDNGDIYVVDKSTNGTYLNGNRLTYGKETPVKRGDDLCFADVRLDWTKIPEITVPKGVKKIVSVGSHYMNAIKIHGNLVSRFHATMRLMDNGNWYICDHSKNGTTVNGKRINKDQYIPLKANDVISCGGVPVQNPVRKGGSGIVTFLAVACAVGVVALGTLFIMSNRNLSDEKLCETYEKSIAMLVCRYHFEVECGTLDISSLPDPDSYNSKRRRFMSKMTDKFIVSGEYIIPYSEEKGNSTTSVATGFFIGGDGYVATNRHVAKPWETLTIPYGDKYVTVLEAAENYYKQKLNELYSHFGLKAALPYISQIKVVGKLDEVVVIPNGSYVDPKNAYHCHEIACGDNIENDLAIFQIRANNIPEDIKYVSFSKINENEPTQGQQVLTIGFPFGTQLQDIEKTRIQANNASGGIARNNNKYTFGFTAVAYQGASGSPVFDRKGRLIGVLCSGIPDVQGYNFAIRSEHLHDLIEESGIKSSK